MEFAWSQRKAAGNLAKHGVSFDEAASVFEDPLFEIYADLNHSGEENRFIIIGESSSHRLLVVVFTDRDESVRIISAREATAKERRVYEEEV